MKNAIKNDIKMEEKPIDGFSRNLEFNIDETYKYVPKNRLYIFCSNILYYGIAFPILKILTKIIYDLKIEGRENIKDLESGAVSVSNHVLILDCAMIGIATSSKRIYYTASEDNFKIPFIRKLIKMLRAIPIPTNLKNREYFMEALDEELEKSNLIHFYAEGSLIPYCKEIRQLKNGAFDVAVKNNVPILPMVFTFREPQGIRKLFKKKQDVTLHILKPIKYEGDSNLDLKNQREILKENVYNEMSNKIKEPVATV